MALLPILVAPDPRLKKVSEPVKAVDERIRRLMDDMLETMYQAPGIGLAAPQVGVVEARHRARHRARRRRAAAAAARQPGNRLGLRRRRHLQRRLPQSCPSTMPTWRARPRAACAISTTRARPQEIEAEGLLATCLQHEIDHLDGVLFIDHLTRFEAQHHPAQAAEGEKGRSRFRDVTRR